MVHRQLMTCEARSCADHMVHRELRSGSDMIVLRCLNLQYMILLFLQEVAEIEINRCWSTSSIRVEIHGSVKLLSSRKVFEKMQYFCYR